MYPSIFGRIAEWFKVSHNFCQSVQGKYTNGLRPKPGSEIGRLDFQEEHKQAQGAFEKIINDYSGTLYDPQRIEYHIKKGKIYQEVINQAEAFDESAIILSTHGASGFEELFIGSNALKIISASDLPVITVRHGAAVRKLRILFSNYPSLVTRQKAPYTGFIAKTFGAEIQVPA